MNELNRKEAYRSGSVVMIFTFTKENLLETECDFDVFVNQEYIGGRKGFFVNSYDWKSNTRDMCNKIYRDFASFYKEQSFCESFIVGKEAVAFLKETESQMNSKILYEREYFVFEKIDTVPKIKKADTTPNMERYQSGNVFFDIQYIRNKHDMALWDYTMYVNGKEYATAVDARTQANEKNMNQVFNELLAEFIFSYEGDDFEPEDLKAYQQSIEQVQEKMVYELRNGKKYYLFEKVAVSI